MDRIIPTTKAVEFRSSEDKGNVIINVGGLTEKVIEADRKEPLEYDEGVIIEESKIDETIIKIASSE